MKYNILSRLHLEALLILFVIMSAVLSSCSKNEIADEQQKVFIKLFGSNGSNQGVAIKKVSDGYVALGTWAPKSGNTKMYLIKTDNFGNEQWSKLYGDSTALKASSLQITSSGFVLLGTITSAQQTDIYLVNVSAKGDTLWTKKLGGSTDEQGNSVIVNSDGQFLVSGYTTSATTKKDPYWALISASGTKIWEKTSVENADNWIESAVQTSDGYVLLGTTADSTATNGSSDILAIKIKPDGTIINIGNFGGTGQDAGTGVALLSDGTLVCSAKVTPENRTNPDIALMCFSIDKTYYKQIWQKNYLMGNSAIGESLTIDQYENIWLCGTATLSDGSSDICLIKTDKSGTSSWTQLISAAGNQSSSSLVTTSDNGAAVIGNNEISSGSMILIVKTNSLGKLE